MNISDDFAKDNPILTTSVVAGMLGITPDRLRMYDTTKLICVHRVDTGQVRKRFYSQYDVEWLKGIRRLLKDHKMSVALVKYLLKMLYKNPKLHYPIDEVSDILKELAKNPNFKSVVEGFDKGHKK